MTSGLMERKSILVAMAARYEMEPGAFEATLRATCGLANATREEFAAFLLVAHEYRLNPVTREIYAFPKKGGGIQPIVSIDGWMKLANAHEQMDGLTFVDRLDESGQLVAITAQVHRRDRAHPIEVTEYLAECRQGTQPWEKWPARMLRHKAAIQAIRYAFGFGGIADPDEAERMAPVPATVVARPRHPAPRLTAPVGASVDADVVSDAASVAGE
jgi:phage recombination protein Bet